jgi:hypothetical protein
MVRRAMLLFASPLLLLAQNGFIGDSVTVDYEWPSLGQVLYNGGAAVVTTAGTTYFLPGQGGVAATITGSTILISGPSWYFETSSPKTFDGWVITDPTANITNAALTTTNIPGLSTSAITSDSHHVYVNFLGFSALPTGFSLTITVSFAGGPSAEVLPHLVFGGGWSTTLYFTNTTSGALSFPVKFIDGNGNALTTANGTSATVNISARGTSSMKFSNTGSLVQGYVSLVLPSGAAGYGVFRQSAAGVPDQEAVVPLSGVSHTTSTLLFDDTNAMITGVALVNLGDAASITATAYDMDGNILGTASIPLAPNGKTAATLQSLISATAGIMGSVDFTVSTGNVAALGLRFDGSAFTSIPTSDR